MEYVSREKLIKLIRSIVDELDDYDNQSLNIFANALGIPEQVNENDEV